MGGAVFRIQLLLRDLSCVKIDSDPAFLHFLTNYNEFLQIFILKAENLMIIVRSLGYSLKV